MMNFEGFCHRWLAAWSSGRLRDLAAFYADHALYSDPLLPAGVSGRVALEAHFETFLARYPNGTWTALEIIPSARGFTLRWQLEIPTSPSCQRIEGVALVELAGELVTRSAFYYDAKLLPNQPTTAEIQPPRILETPRLILRPHQKEQLENLAAMWAEPEVVRYISGIPSTRAESWFRLLHYAGLWAHLGYGYWAIIEKASGRFIGDLGFADFKRDIEPPIEGVPELGWVLTPTAHGKGYATEGVQAALAWSDAYLSSARTVCIIDPDNGASRRVAEKCGFYEVARPQFRGAPTLLYERWKGAVAALR